MLDCKAELPPLGATANFPLVCLLGLGAKHPFVTALLSYFCVSLCMTAGIFLYNLGISCILNPSGVLRSPSPFGRPCSIALLQRPPGSQWVTFLGSVPSQNVKFPSNRALQSRATPCTEQGRRLTRVVKYALVMGMPWVLRSRGWDVLWTWRECGAQSTIPPVLRWPHSQGFASTWQDVAKWLVVLEYKKPLVQGSGDSVSKGSQDRKSQK